MHGRQPSAIGSPRLRVNLDEICDVSAPWQLRKGWAGNVRIQCERPLNLEFIGTHYVMRQPVERVGATVYGAAECLRCNK